MVAKVELIKGKVRALRNRGEQIARRNILKNRMVKPYLFRYRRQKAIDAELRELLGIQRKFFRFWLFCLLSRSQLSQDYLASSLFQKGAGRSFVEFGACDGRISSNTLMLERFLGWFGALAEANPVFHNALKRNRRSARIFLEAVWTKSGDRVEFLAFGGRDATLSSITATAFRDRYSEHRDSAAGNVVEVDTISLNDLIVRAFEKRSPATQGSAGIFWIDYLSADTEGSEFEILDALDWERFRFGLITVEHNDSAQKSKIENLLLHHGYRCLAGLVGVSGGDGWFIARDRPVHEER